jgi:7-cyano-7-deazaguanine synthase
MKTAILLSGGLDSFALCYWTRPDIAFTINYGQRAADAEIEAAKVLTKKLSIRHEIIRAECSQIGFGQLSFVSRRSKLAVRPPTPEWWPFRNQLLITVGAAKAVTMGIKQLLIGSVNTDSRHLDGTPRFVKLMSAVLLLQEGSIRLLAPAIRLSSSNLIQKSGIPVELLGWAHSCHRGNYSCGICSGCVKNQQVWNEVALEKDKYSKRRLK